MPKKPATAAFIKFTPRLIPKNAPKKFTTNKITKPKAAFISSFITSLIGAVSIFSETKHRRITAPKISRLEIVTMLAPFLLNALKLKENIVSSPA